MSYKAANNSYEAYKNSINHILESNKDFFNNSNITGIFGVNDHFGMLYCKEIAKEFPQYTEAIRNGQYKIQIENSNCIGQKTFFSTELNTEISANIARYIYHALVIHKYINTKFNSNIDILEIGGGYGGLCYWLQVFCSTINTYTIIDLEEANHLQKYYLNQVNTPGITISNVDNFSKSSRPLFIISNYGYSEFNEFYQTLYKNTILKVADGGFMVWNNWSGIINFTDLQMIIEKERPEFPDCPNKFIYF